LKPDGEERWIDFYTAMEVAVEVVKNRKEEMTGEAEEKQRYA
jgi:hypothetical protein